MQEVAAVLLPVAPLRGVRQTEDQLEGLDPQLDTGRAGGEWESEGKGGKVRGEDWGGR